MDFPSRRFLGHRAGFSHGLRCGQPSRPSTSWMGMRFYLSPISPTLNEHHQYECWVSIICLEFPYPMMLGRKGMGPRTLPDCTAIIIIIEPVSQSVRTVIGAVVISRRRGMGDSPVTQGLQQSRTLLLISPSRHQSASPARSRESTLAFGLRATRAEAEGGHYPPFGSSYLWGTCSDPNLTQPRPMAWHMAATGMAID